MSVISPPLPSPGVGARRKHQTPRLPLSAFTPPNTGASDQFPLPPSPSTVQPQKIVDAHVVLSNPDLTQWKADAGDVLADRIAGVVVSIQGESSSALEQTVAQISSGALGVPVVAVVVPFSLEQGVPSHLPSYLAYDSTPSPPIALSTVFTSPSPENAEALKWALDKQHTVTIDIQSDIHTDAAWNALEDLLTAADVPRTKGKIVLSNILPPPDDLALPIVKLLTHPSYRNYQARIAALSLYSDIYIHFLPPSWNAPVPTADDTKDSKEWKRRIKMYIGPVLEAFGFQRIIFGSAPSPSARGTSRPADWYALARESFAELGVEQDAVDAVFYHNALAAYAPA